MLKFTFIEVKYVAAIVGTTSSKGFLVSNVAAHTYLGLFIIFRPAQ